MTGHGRRSHFAKTMAPSAVPLRLGEGVVRRDRLRQPFGTPEEMTQEDVDQVTGLFRASARMAYEAGFGGIELHSAHGYLLAQFLSAKTSLLSRINTAAPRQAGQVRRRHRAGGAQATSPEFCVRHQVQLGGSSGRAAELEARLQQLRLIESAGIDFLEISGGDYENPTVRTGSSSWEPPFPE